MQTVSEMQAAILQAWPVIQKECLSVLGSELHYQAMIYHILRSTAGVPIDQLGMNVKIYIEKPTSVFFKNHEKTRKKGFEGCEPTPDIALFRPGIESDWRRQQHENSLQQIQVAIEVKVSEGRLTPCRVIPDLNKLAALREEVERIGSTLLPVMLIIDSAPTSKERITEQSLNAIISNAWEQNIPLLYASKKHEYNSLKDA